MGLGRIYVSFEDTADEVLKPRLLACGGEPDRVHELVPAEGTIVSLREAVCPFCRRPYRDEYRLDLPEAPAA